MELQHENYDEAIRVMQCAAAIPKNTKILMTILFKSLKLWSFLVDLEESIGTIELTKAIYNKIIDLKIANAQVIVNYTAFLEGNQYWKDSFKVRFV
ncbi:hypothetical protein BDR03DRAFT_1012018 [Suillus americanus]|nr:hypothetical protein BDR03DRAFT_1012018 [Suillus americanus]